MKPFRCTVICALMGFACSAMAIQVYILPTVTKGFPIKVTGTCDYTFNASPGAQPCSYPASTATFNFTDSTTPKPNSCTVTLDSLGNIVAASTTCTAVNSGGTTILVSALTPPPPPGVQVYISQGNALSFPVTLTGGCPGSFSSGSSAAIGCTISAATTTSTLTDNNKKTCALVMTKMGNLVTLSPSTTCVVSSSGGAHPTFTVTGMFPSMPIYLSPNAASAFPIAVTGTCTLSLKNKNAMVCNVPLGTPTVTLNLSDAKNNQCTLILNNGPGGVLVDANATCQATSTRSVPATINITSTTPLPGCGGYNGGNSSSWCTTARYGDYLGAQLKSTRKFGYGMFVVKMMAANGPTCSTFWLYSDAPAPGAAPEIAQLWRWNEFDVEFVPYTQATQNAYVLYNGPSTASTYYGSTLDWSAMSSGQILPNLVQWVQGKLMTDDVVFADMQKYYNLWMVAQNLNNQIPTHLMNFAGAQQTTGPGFTIGGTAPNAGWPQASVWKYPLTAVAPVSPQAATPVGSPLQMVALNWWRMPTGQSSIPVNLPGVGSPYDYSYILKLPVLDGSNATTSATAMSLNNELYVFPGASTFTPYAALNTYTITWTPTRVAFYINAPNNGQDIDAAVPVVEYKNTGTNPDFPSMAASGTQAPQGMVTWVDTSLADQLGQVSINLANYVAFQAAANVPNNQLGGANAYAGSGWSGTPPASGFKSTTAYFRSVKYYAYSGTGEGKHASDFSKTPIWGFDLSDGTWNAGNFQTNLANYFGMLYAQDATSSGGGSTFPSRDAKSPLAVSFVSNSDGAIAKDKNPLMGLTVTPSQVNPLRNFFVIKTTMSTSLPVSSSNPFMFITYTPQAGKSIGVSGVSTPLSFFAPPIPTTSGTPCTSPYTGKAGTCSSITGTINLYMSNTYHAAFPSGKVPTSPDATATVTLYTDSYGYIWWAPLSDPSGILATFQAENPQSITVQSGSATPGS